MMRFYASALFAATAATSSAIAGSITFETIPGGSPAEGLEISNQFSESDGVLFSLEGGGYPVLAEVGSPTTAFRPSDTPLASANSGSFFLTDDGILGGNSVSEALIVEYQTPTASASASILDIDFDESFEIQLRGASNEILDVITISSGDPGTGDAAGAVFAFERDEADVFSLRLQGVRNAGGAFGLGFDNFNTGVTDGVADGEPMFPTIDPTPPTMPTGPNNPGPQAVPTPTALGAGLSLLGLASASRRRRD